MRKVGCFVGIAKKCLTKNVIFGNTYAAWDDATLRHLPLEEMQSFTKGRAWAMKSSVRVVGMCLALVLMGALAAEAGAVYLTPYNENHDGDSIMDLVDNAPFHDNEDQADVDGDGWGDVADLTFGNDSDDDTVDDPADADPNDPAVGAPTFNIGGPYTVNPGSNLIVAFAFSPTPVQSPFFVSLDGGNDGSVEAWWVGGVGEGSMDLSWAVVQALGLDSGTNTLKATANHVVPAGWGVSDVCDTTATSVPEPTAFALPGLFLFSMLLSRR